MKLELIVFGITAFLVYNAYHDGKYWKLLMSYKKYYTMAFFAILGIGFYLMIKRNPSQCKNMLLHANNVVKYMPISKSSMDMLTPILDLTTGGNENANSFMENYENINNNNPLNPSNTPYVNSSGVKRMLQSGKGSTKRSVSETKKKFVASQQNWKCGECQKQLTAWFEVDHKIRLEYGGSNEVSNLVALCRECHGEKTAMENM
jgi:5-methylcytosine-specific restriction endonuclease McrA